MLGDDISLVYVSMSIYQVFSWNLHLFLLVALYFRQNDLIKSGIDTDFLFTPVSYAVVNSI